MSNSNKQTLSDRMKEYESVSDFKLMRRCPVIIRLDGRAFSKVTRKLEKPSKPFAEAMSFAMFNVVKDIEGAVFSYTQSDEVTILLKNDQSNFSQPWFDNRIQKITSIAASEMTYYFIKELNRLNLEVNKTVFDCRVFTVPSLIEAVNHLIWRQRDCIRNMISVVVDSNLRAKFGAKKTQEILHNKGAKERIQLLYDECIIDFWKDIDPMFIRGVAAYKSPEEKMDLNEEKFIRNTWILNKNLPEFENDFSLIEKAYNIALLEE